MKLCSRCGLEKPFDEFPSDKTRRDNLYPFCKSCETPRKRDAQYRRLYGITLEDYEVMLNEQNGMCAICEKREAKCVDHCHVTGRVRGLLCYKCNTGIGNLQDDVVLLHRAIKYLEER